MYTITKWSRTKNDKYSHFYLECVFYAALYNDGHFWRSPGDHVSPSSGSSVKYRRSLQQNTVRDATHHGNTLQRRRQSGEGGVMCFSSSKATTLKVNFNLNSKESNREWQNLQLRRLWSENTGGGFHRDKKVQVADFTAHFGSEAWHATRPASCAPILWRPSSARRWPTFSPPTDTNLVQWANPSQAYPKAKTPRFHSEDKTASW